MSCYSYDSAGRLSGFVDDVAARAITVDHDSGRLTYGDPTRQAAAPLSTQTYNADDSVQGATVDTGAGAPTTAVSTYLPFGGLADDGCAAYTYDGYDRQTRAAGNGNPGCGNAYATDYTRDPAGRIQTRTDTGAGAPTTGSTADSYDGASTQIVAEAHPATLTTYAAAGPTGLLAADTPLAGPAGVGQPLVTDPAGNVAATATPAGTLGCALRYDPYGNPTHTAPAQPAGQQCANTGGATLTDLRYQAAQQDPTNGDYHFGARTYDPAKAAFTTPDTADQTTGTDPQSIGVDPLTRDTYNYVNGDPLNAADPSGHHPVCGESGAAEQACEHQAEQSALPALERTAAVEVLAGRALAILGR